MYNTANFKWAIYLPIRDDTHRISKQTGTKCEAATMIFSWSVKYLTLYGLVEKLKYIYWSLDRDQQDSHRRRVRQLTVLFVYVPAIILVSNKVLQLLDYLSSARLQQATHHLNRLCLSKYYFTNIVVYIPWISLAFFISFVFLLLIRSFT